MARTIFAEQSLHVYVGLRGSHPGCLRDDCVCTVCDDARSTHFECYFHFAGGNMEAPS